VLRAGVPLAFGSDFPIESPDVRLGLVAAETRLAAGARAPFLPEERLGREEALRAFTAGAAYAAFADGRRGVIREGMDADLTAFAGDVLAVPASALARLEVTHTIVGGRIAFER
jgi:predicted amidohydrolase YtcJ